MKKYIKFGSLLLISCVASLLEAACSSSSNTKTPGSSADPSSSSNLTALYHSDIANFSQIDLSALQNDDSQLPREFSSLFGGTTPNDVIGYYQARVQYALTADQFAEMQISPASFPNMGWDSLPQSSPTPEPTNTSNGIQIGALNQSTFFWLMGAVNDTPVTLTWEGQQIALTSTRVGVIELGPGYAATQTEDDGTPISIPPAYRQAILVHEARHSDCTDGLSANELAMMKNETSLYDFYRDFPLPHCGHLHVTCPSGTYANLPACDAERYGAYTVGAVYAAALSGSQTDGISTKIMQITAIDNASRYIGSSATSPDEDAPNMTSSGLTP